MDRTPTPAPIRRARRTRALGRLHRSRLARSEAFRRPWTLVLGVIICVEIVVWMGVGTDWFGWGPSHVGTSSGNGNGSSPSLNPFNETIQSVLAGIRYDGNRSGYFPALDGTDVCGHCPALPFTDENYAPAVAGFWFYFNVTNTAPVFESISNFSLSTSGANPGLFTPGGLACCFPSFGSPTIAVGFLPGQTLGLAVFVHAPTIPNVGPAGFTLFFNATTP